VEVRLGDDFARRAGGDACEASGSTARELIRELTQRWPALGDLLLAPRGGLAPRAQVLVNGMDVRLLGGLGAALLPRDRIEIETLSPAPLLPREAERYARQIILGEIGPWGQARLGRATVAVVGAGGLGAPAATYLAAAGVGHLRVIDGDVVERSNLHRQPIHRDRDVGGPKAKSAARALRELNPDIEVEAVDQYLGAANALGLLQDCDLIVNASDNFPTRYLVSDAAVLLGRPLVDASILRFEGRLMVFLPRQGCYRCLYPVPPEPGSVPSCGEAGVIGALGGEIGSLQALEAVKLITGAGESLGGQMVVFDALSGARHAFRLPRDPGCPVCGDHPTQLGLVDYEDLCGVAAPARDAPALTVSVTDAIALRGDPRVQWVDVRRQDRGERPTIPGAVRMPLEALDPEALDRGRPVVLFCDIGRRSLLAAQELLRRGVPARSLEGGVVAWTAAGQELDD